MNSQGLAVGSAFADPLPIPRALRPIDKSEYSAWASPPGPGYAQQDSIGYTHQMWPDYVGYPDPIVYKISVQVNTHRFSSLNVLPINAGGKPTESYDAARNTYQAGKLRKLPDSTIYGFNGKFGSTRINAEYGKPVLIRFVNELDRNDMNLDRQDFGDPNLGFLTHLHNGHTAAESDGNPHHMMWHSGKGGYDPGQWCDNLYCNYPAGGDDKEKQSFLWFHDHRMDHTGANV